MPSGIPFVISAPSGVGKSTLIRELRTRDPGIGFSVSYTTRSPREGEVDGVDYHFVNRAVFERMIAGGEFVEWAEVHVNFYGTNLRALESQLQDGRDAVLDIDVQGALQVAERVPGAVLIFIVPPSWEELRRRIETRKLDSPEAIARRIQNARGELAQASQYDYLVVNDRIEAAMDDITAIMRVERCRPSRRTEALDRLLASSSREDPDQDSEQTPSRPGRAP